MFRKYLVTGAAGFLGRTVIAALDAAGNPEIHALVMQGDPLVNELPDHVHVSFGDICEPDSLEHFFSAADQQTCVIHCAGFVSVASHPGERIYRVNAGGTANVLRYCTNYNVGKLIYVSSVHAIPKNAMQTGITKETLFSPDLVSGDYAKSKAIAPQWYLMQLKAACMSMWFFHPGSSAQTTSQTAASLRCCDPLWTTSCLWQ